MTVKKMLKESEIHCRITPFQKIYKSAKKIVDIYDNFDFENGNDLDSYVYNWAKKTLEEAESWMTYCSDFGESIGYGRETWNL